MALDYTVRYAGQFAADPDYPQGKPQNVVVEGDGNGSPFEADLLADFFGMLQALLLASGITPSGDPDTANASQYKEAIAWVAAAAHGAFDPRSPAYGAVGNGIANDTTALNSCIAAAAAAGGSVNLGGKTYRVTAKLVCSPTVDVRNGALVLDAASPDYFLEFATGSAGSRAAVWENVTLSFANNAAIMVRNVTVAVKVRFVNCKLDGSTGAAAVGLVYSEPASEFTFEECESIVPANATTGFFTTAGKLTVRGGKVKALAGFTGLLFNGSGGTQQLDGVTYDTTAVVAGTCACVNIGGQRVLADGCMFDNTGGSATNIAFQSSLAANTGLITERGSTFRSIVSYSFAFYMERSSSIELEPQYVLSFNGASVTIPATAKSASLRSTNASTTPPTFNFAPPLVQDQAMDVLISNDHTAAWSGNVVLGGVNYDDSDAALTDLPSNNPSNTGFLLLHLRAYRYEGSPAWYVSKGSQISLL